VNRVPLLIALTDATGNVIESQWRLVDGDSTILGVAVAPSPGTVSLPALPLSAGVQSDQRFDWFVE
jgi:hypothetical protein